jgi:hypothetical protein
MVRGIQEKKKLIKAGLGIIKTKINSKIIKDKIGRKQKKIII